jgi:hypothetical protein
VAAEATALDAKSTITLAAAAAARGNLTVGAAAKALAARADAAHAARARDAGVRSGARLDAPALQKLASNLTGGVVAPPPAVAKADVARYAVAGGAGLDPVGTALWAGDALPVAAAAAVGAAPANAAAAKVAAEPEPARR